MPSSRDLTREPDELTSLNDLYATRNEASHLTLTANSGTQPGERPCFFGLLVYFC